MLPALLNFDIGNSFPHCWPKYASLGTVMFEPYVRIFIQQFTVIVGSFILMFGAGKIFILFFALVKIFFTVAIDYEAMLKKATSAQESSTSHS